MKMIIRLLPVDSLKNKFDVEWKLINENKCIRHSPTLSVSFHSRNPFTSRAKRKALFLAPFFSASAQQAQKPEKSKQRRRTKKKECEKKGEEQSNSAPVFVVYRKRLSPDGRHERLKKRAKERERQRETESSTVESRT